MTNMSQTLYSWNAFSITVTDMTRSLKEKLNDFDLLTTKTHLSAFQHTVIHKTMLLPRKP